MRSLPIVAAEADYRGVLGHNRWAGGSLFLYNGNQLFSTGAVPGVPQAAISAGDLMVPPSTSQHCTTVNGAQQCLPQYGDLVSDTTLEDQNSAPPSEKIFGRHFIVKVVPPVVASSADQYYDPSYGRTYTDQNYFETNAVDGYAIQLSGNVFFVEPSAGLGQIVFNH